MVEQIVPILKVADAIETAQWYARLGFETEFVHRYSEEFPAYVGVARNGMAIHLSEHAGDATPDSLVYVFVDDVDAIAGEFGLDVSDETWAREVQLTDPDGNRLRVATRRSAEA